MAAIVTGRNLVLRLILLMPETSGKTKSILDKGKMVKEQKLREFLRTREAGGDIVQELVSRTGKRGGLIDFNKLRNL